MVDVVDSKIRNNSDWQARLLQKLETKKSQSNATTTLQLVHT